MRWLLGGWIVLVLVAGATAVAVDVLELGDDNVSSASPTSTTTPIRIVPPAGQVTVTGVLTALRAENVVLPPVPMPITVTTPERGFGAGAVISGAFVDGELTSIVWDAGLPLEIIGEGVALLLAPAHVDGNAGGFVVLLDGAVHGFAPGDYRILTPVAVGSGGLAEPRDSVEFTADVSTTVSFTGTATVTLPAQLIQFAGPGELDLTGTFTVSGAEGTQAATRVLFGPGPFELNMAPDPGGFTVDATLNGPLQLL